MSGDAKDVLRNEKENEPKDEKENVPKNVKNAPKENRVVARNNLKYIFMYT